MRREREGERGGERESAHERGGERKGGREGEGEERRGRKRKGEAHGLGPVVATCDISRSYVRHCWFLHHMMHESTGRGNGQTRVGK